MDYTMASGKYKGSVKFVGPEGPNKGKLMSNQSTRDALQWRPKYPSFEEFMAAGAEDFYTQQKSGVAIVGASHA